MADAIKGRSRLAPLEELRATTLTATKKAAPIGIGTAFWRWLCGLVWFCLACGALRA
jgi:hypothetical protein